MMPGPPYDEPTIGGIAMSVRITTWSKELDGSRIGACLAAAALGAALVFIAGFAPQEVVHNAAHDTRHAYAFPCH